MTLELSNTSHYKGKMGNRDWWSWKGYIKSDKPEELDSIEFVDYQLHPTFKEPIRRVKEKNGGFPLRTSGWGVFELKATVYFKDKEKEPVILKHRLQFVKPPDNGDDAPK